jgi:signal transduction histidine kinase
LALGPWLRARERDFATTAPTRNAISVLARIAVGHVGANDPGMRGLRILACGVALATFASLTVGLLQVLEVFHSDQEDWIPLAVYPFLALAILSPAVIGLLIAVQLPRNRIAWILLLGALLPALQIASEQIAGAAWSYQTEAATVPPVLFAWPLAVAFVFPNGRLLSRRWRWVVGMAIVSFAFTIGLKLFDPEPFPPPNEDITNPLLGNAVGEFIVDTGIWIPFAIGVVASLFAGALAVILRFRRSVGVERLQMQWLVWGASLIPLVLVLDIVMSSWFGGGGATTFALLLAAQFALVAAIGIAVVRYRLYAVERLVNRTLVYVMLTLLLIAVYVGISIGLGVLVGGESTWVVALATLGVALAFRPLRTRVQDLVDRRFRRARHEGVRLVRAFEDEVRDGTRAPEEIGAVLADALQDPLAEIFFWIPETETYADTTGERLHELPNDERARREIQRDDKRTAVLLHEPTLLERRDLFDGILSAAALSIEMARLRVEVRLQLAEVQASQARIVEAGYEERRRLERDLHDGAQQRLVSLGVQVRRLQLSLPRDAARILSPALDQIVAEVGAAIADLRQIAAGVRPARLDEGLAAALRDLARTAPVPVDVEASGERAPASAEAAAYFVACEALTNAVKHGSPSKVSVRAVQDDGTLHVTVVDDGVGGAVVRRGSGLAGLRDRVAAHGGTLEIVSPRGSGTRVEVAIPCGS